MKKVLILLVLSAVLGSCLSTKKLIKKHHYTWSKDTLTKKQWNNKLSNFIDSFNTSYLKNNK